jgi:hypothetical protein
METFLFYKESITTALIIGLLFGLVSRLNLWITILVGGIGAGVLTLLLTGDWRLFFRDGFTLFHLVYFAGHMATSIGFFGPVGAFAAFIAIFLRRCIGKKSGSGADS